MLNVTIRYDVRSMQPSHIVISPGPGTPDDSGVSLDVLRYMGETTPVLGVCLGHQCIGQVYGGVVARAPHLMHGKTSMVYHNDDGLFAGVSNPFEATRYHSLIVLEDTVPVCLSITARTDDGLIMGLQHKQLAVYGVQFHPESILTTYGPRILQNFLQIRVPERA
jgi:anthranilate synthase component II